MLHSFADEKTVKDELGLRAIMRNLINWNALRPQQRLDSLVLVQVSSKSPNYSNPSPTQFIIICLINPSLDYPSLIKLINPLESSCPFALLCMAPTFQKMNTDLIRLSSYTDLPI